MADLPTITWTSGVPDTGQSGTVMTISNLTDRIGEVQASPTSNTVLDRLKTLNSSLAAKGTQASPSADYLSSVVAGDIAHDAPDSGNPAKIGGKALTALPTAVAASDRVNAMFDKFGRAVSIASLRENLGVTQTQLSNTTSETTIVASVASTFVDLYGLILANTGSSGTKVTIKDATSGTTRAIVYVPATETRGFMLPVDSAIPQASAANNWTATCGTATTALEVTAMWAQRA